MTTKDEVARRVAERLGLNLLVTPLTIPLIDPLTMWDALISSEMRVEDAIALADENNQKWLDAKLHADMAEVRVSHLEEALHEAEELLVYARARLSAKEKV